MSELPKLTEENYSKGFLVDEEWIGGITADAESPGRFAAYVLRHTTGETVAYQEFESLSQAIELLNAVPRNWAYEALGGCANGDCQKGNCRSGKCAVSRAASGLA
ncbi:MAG: hypothetical protein P4M08_12200 [Oligoflexia bacterium]|nr:hypothetical protein [Oligoflexia bacterium]